MEKITIKKKQTRLPYTEEERVSIFKENKLKMPFPQETKKRYKRKDKHKKGWQ